MLHRPCIAVSKLPDWVPFAGLHAWGQERETVERKMVSDKATNIQMKSYKEGW